MISDRLGDRMGSPSWWRKIVGFEPQGMGRSGQWIW